MPIRSGGTAALQNGGSSRWPLGPAAPDCGLSERTSATPSQVLAVLATPSRPGKRPPNGLLSHPLPNVLIVNGSRLGSPVPSVSHRPSTVWIDRAAILRRPSATSSRSLGPTGDHLRDAVDPGRPPQRALMGAPRVGWPCPPSGRIQGSFELFTGELHRSLGLATPRQMASSICAGTARHPKKSIAAVAVRLSDDYSEPT